MKRTVSFPDTRPGIKILWFTFIVLFSLFIFSLAGIIGGTLLYGKDLATIYSVFANPKTAEDRSFLYFVQFINQIGFLFVPAFLFTYLFSVNRRAYLRLNSTFWGLILIAGISVFTILPFINWLTEINSQMTFPRALAGIGEWMKTREIQADRLTNFFMETKSIKGLALNIFIIGLIPAFGEELLFRGLLQRLLNEWTRSIPAGVLLTAFIFSAIHMQFFGFLPRFVLGIMLGAMLEITQSLWVPVFAHFVNNTTLVILYFLHNNGINSMPTEDFGTSHNVFVIVLSAVITLTLFFWMKRIQSRYKNR